MDKTPDLLQDTPFFKSFIARNELNDIQIKQFLRYLNLLLQWNEDMNLTAIVKPENVVAYHFQDSLQLDEFFDFSSIKSMADIGTGAGFPGVPLKIKYPHLRLILIEVNNKRIRFLHKIIEELGLDNVVVYDKDWRTFLRKTEYDIDLFVTRATLSMDELMRLYKPGCRYKMAQFIYWASQDWSGDAKYASHIVKDELYQIKNKKRRYIFFENSHTSS